MKTHEFDIRVALVGYVRYVEQYGLLNELALGPTDRMN